MKPLCIDLYCGLGGWSEGFLSEGYECIGFDIERHDYGPEVSKNGDGSLHIRPGGYPGQLVLQDVTTLHGSQFRDAACIVASPPCQNYSYMAMPWKRAKQMADHIRRDPARIVKLNELFDSCFRIQREASEAAGRRIPLVVENVKGAQPWVGSAAWHFGSFYLWGDIPALMPHTLKAVKVGGITFSGYGTPGYRGVAFNSTAVQRMREGVKQGGSGEAWFDKALDERRKAATAIKNGNDWFGSGENCSLQRRASSHSTARKAASAQIAKIPFELSQHIAKVFKP